MKTSAASIIDSILLCAMLIIGSTMLATSWSTMSESVVEIETQDKTALKNYTGRVEDTFKYTGRDVILSVVIGDQYEPDYPELKIVTDSGSSIIVDADPMSKVNGNYEESYINKDRITYIQEIWSSYLKEFNTDREVEYTRECVSTDGSKYRWYVKKK